MALARPRLRLPAAFVLLVLLAASSWPAAAGTIDSVEVAYAKKRYSLAIDARLSVPIEQLRNLLTDYPRVAKANAAIQSLSLRPSPAEGVTRIAAELKICVWFYCRRLRQVQDMQLQSPFLLDAQILASESDFDYGYARWLMATQTGGSSLRFTAELQPSFWVPPLIGPLLIKRKLKQEAVATVLAMELLAAEQIDD